MTRPTISRFFFALLGGAAALYAASVAVPTPVEAAEPAAVTQAHPMNGSAKASPNTKTDQSTAKLSKSAAAAVVRPSAAGKTEVAIFGPKNISGPTKAAAADSHSPAKNGSGDKKASVGNGSNDKKASANNGSNNKKVSANKEEESKLSAKAERRELRMRANLVPPPPPETPVVLTPQYGNGMYSQQFAPLELMSREGLQQRQKLLTTQLDTAKRALKDQQQVLDERADRAKQFSQLYNEGVISRRELEYSDEDLRKVQSDLDSAKEKVEDFKLSLDRVNEKLKYMGKLGLKPSRYQTKEKPKRAVAVKDVASAKPTSIGIQKQASINSMPVTNSAGAATNAKADLQSKLSNQTQPSVAPQQPPTTTPTDSQTPPHTPVEPSTTTDSKPRLLGL